MAALEPSSAELLESRWTRVAVERTIQSDVETIWSHVSDTAAWLDWYRPLSVFEPIGEPNSGLGARFREREWVWETTSEIVAWQPSRLIGLSTTSINLAGLLKQYYRQIDIVQQDDGQSAAVRMTAGFQLGPLSWFFLPYAYPQLTLSIWLEFRSALRGLDNLIAP